MGPARRHRMSWWERATQIWMSPQSRPRWIEAAKSVLQGHFSFDQPPTRPTPPEAFSPRLATVLVSKEVVISGTHDQRGEMTTIDGGTWPFAIEASGVPVTIQGLR